MLFEDNTANNLGEIHLWRVTTHCLRGHTLERHVQQAKIANTGEVGCVG